MIKIHWVDEHPSKNVGMLPFGNFAERLDILQTSKHVLVHAFVVVIDDSATICKIVETCLGREGYEVKSFQDGVEAMRWLMMPGAPLPHLVILDVGLPKMDGYEVARYLKSKPQFRNTVIMMLTRRDGIVDRLKGRLAGAHTYLTKPVTTQALISAVEAHLGAPEHSEL